MFKLLKNYAHFACQYEMAGWHHWLYGLESEWTPGVGDGQGGLACCDSWGCKELDMTEWLNWTKLISSEEILVKESRGSPLWCSSGKSRYRKDKEDRPKESHCGTLPHFSSLFFWILEAVDSVIWPRARSQSWETLESWSSIINLISSFVEMYLKEFSK